MFCGRGGSSKKKGGLVKLVLSSDLKVLMGEKVKASTKKRQTAPRSGRTLAAVCKDIDTAVV